jgi:S1-C subfamily serine protease
MKNTIKNKFATPKALIIVMLFLNIAVYQTIDAQAGLFGHYFGAILDCAETSIDGVRLDGVRPESPAEEAGLQEDDIIVKFGGEVIKNCDDFNIAHKKQLPGAVEVIYIRQGKEHRTEAVLEAAR